MPKEKLEIRTLADDHGVTFEYAGGSARLYGADGADRMLTFPDVLARAGSRRSTLGPSLTVRTCKPADAGKPRAIDLTDYAADTPFERVIGKCQDGYRLFQTNGHAAVLTCEGAIDGAPLRFKTGPTAPLRCVLTPEVWRAYARVRTCRSRSQAVRWTVTPDGALRFTTADQDAGCEAAESVPDAGAAAGADPYTWILSDEYVWPLRGAAGALRQVEPTAPVWIAGLDPLAVVIMPMRD